MTFDRRLLSVILVFLVVSAFSLVLTMSLSGLIPLVFITAVTAMSFIFAWLSQHKITPIPFKDGQFKIDILTILLFYGLIMLVRLNGYWQDGMFAEKAGIIALTVSSIVIIDRSSVRYFGVHFNKPYSQILWALLAIAVIWIGFAIYRFGLPLLLGLKTTGVLFETPVFDAKFIIYGFLLIFWNFSEELFFRGYVLVKLEQSIRFWLSLAISSVLFGLYHVNYILSYKGTDPIGYIAIYILFCTLFGIGMGLLFKLTKSVLVTTTVHVFWNLFFASRYLIPKLYIDYGKSSFPLADFDYMFATVFFIVVLLALYAIMRRKARNCGQTI